MLVGKTHVRVWHAWLMLGVIVGAISGIILVANRSGEFEAGKVGGITRGQQKTILDSRNVYSPEGVMQDGTLRLYYGGWILPGQVHDNIYRSTCTAADTCGVPQIVLDSAALGFEHLNDPAIVKMSGGTTLCI